GSLIDVGVEQGLIKKSGAWYTYESDQLGQGKENVRSFLRDNPDLADEIEKRIKEKLGVGARVDSETTPVDALPAPVDFEIGMTSDEQDAPGDPESVARAICLRLLAQRARTRAELAQALRRRGVPDGAAGSVLDRFAEVGLIDDAALAQNAALTHRERG